MSPTIRIAETMLPVVLAWLPGDAHVPFVPSGVAEVTGGVTAAWNKVGGLVWNSPGMISVGAFHGSGDGSTSNEASGCPVPPADCNGNGVPDEAEAGDVTGNGAVDLADLAALVDCLTGPCDGKTCDPPPAKGSCCHIVDFDADCDVDHTDTAEFQRMFTQCTSNVGCDDGLFCTGAEVCLFGMPSGGLGCMVPGDPCRACEICDEENDQCVPVILGECGNGLVEGCEECDDGNTVPGDGCDENCRFEPGTLENDNCENPTSVIGEVTDFTTEGATTDGPDEPTACDFFGYTHIESDIWFCYEATCTGELVVSLCGSAYDSKMAVYDGCECPRRCRDDHDEG